MQPGELRAKLLAGDLQTQTLRCRRAGIYEIGYRTMGSLQKPWGMASG